MMHLLSKSVLFSALLPLSPTLTAATTDKMSFWTRTPRGANLASTNPVADYGAARDYGIRLLRFGATGSPGDLRFLVREVGGKDEWDLSEKNIEKLKSLAKDAADQGQNIVISLAHVPGRAWKFRKKDYRIWRERIYRVWFVQAWKIIARALRDFDNVVGYDLLNEPYLPIDTNGQETLDGIVLLQSLYEETITAIRSVDPFTPVILESSDMASPAALTRLSPVSDSRTLYSFHYYDPFPYFSPPLNRGNYCYPGLIPPKEGAAAIQWDRSEHLKSLTPVRDWQVKHKLEPYRVFVGEFGVWRKAEGAKVYLRDLTSIFEDFGWSWTYYAFRENDWDVADLELEGQSTFRSKTELFKVIQRSFQ